MTRVEIDGISKSYQRGVPVLKPIRLTIEPGELFFLLGPSGCGKSTLLRILAGLVEPDGGEIRFNGEPITLLPAEKRRAAMVFQNYALWPHLSVYENVAFGLRAAGAPRSEIEREVKAALELVRLPECARRRIPSLSGGQQQRVALARALAVKPALLLLDEPLSNLDARLRDTMRREIRRICKERNLTALYVTHDRQEALSMADRLAVMNEGVLQQTGTPEEVYDRPANRFVAGFLGDANFLSGTATGRGTIMTAEGEITLHCDLPAGTECTAMIRPGRIRFAETPGANRLAARTLSRTFLGESAEWELLGAGGTRLLVTESGPSPRRKTGECYLELPPDELVLLEK